MYYVYVIRSEKRNYTYVGFTNNLERRLNQHQNGKSRSTAPYRPFNLLFVKECSTSFEAREEEKYLKSGQGRKYIKSLI